jgi:nucleotide-binding universal stress UspA family protein
MRRATIYLDGSPNDKESLGFALSFCEKLNCRLTVTLILPPEEIMPAAMDSVVTVIDNRAEHDAAQALGRAAYKDMCAGKPFVDYTESPLGVVDAIAEGGYLFDVTILERLTSTEGSEVTDFNAALFNSGAPVLIAPPGKAGWVGGHATLVWNNTIQAGRAIRSAVPILRRAKTVTILTNSANAAADPDEVKRYLASHEVVAEAKNYRSENLTARGRGRAVLAAAEEAGSDVLVMGAFGESQISALLGLGRATEKIVTACKIPVLVQA